MNSQGYSFVPLNACVYCKQSKRKCSKTRPNCTTCAKVGKSCVYEEDTHPILQNPTFLYIEAHQSRPEATAQPILEDPSPLYTEAHQRSSDDVASGPSIDTSSHVSSSSLIFPSSVTNVDPFRSESLRQLTVDNAILKQSVNMFLSGVNIKETAIKFFDTLAIRQPIVSRERYLGIIAKSSQNSKADFLLLAMAIQLVLQNPGPKEQSMLSSRYITLKSCINLFESSGFLSLDSVQARVLIAIYEIGHGIHPGASISIAACARTARLLGLNKKTFQKIQYGREAQIRAEEEKRTWWAIVKLDRLINLCNGDALCITEDPHSDDILPIEDAMWLQDILPQNTYLTLATPADTIVAPFARECQISHLIGRVLSHVFDPTSETDFHDQEALQLERTLLSFRPLLIEEQKHYDFHCSALGMCGSALFTLYESALLSGNLDNDSRTSTLKSLEYISTQIFEFSEYLFRDLDKVKYNMMSPFVPQSLYQAAIVQFRLWKQTNETRYKTALDSLKQILGHFNKRWLVAGKYLEALENIKADYPLTMLPLHGSYVSATGPSC